MKKTLIAIVVLIILVGGGWYAYSKGYFNNLGTPTTGGTATTSATTVATVNGTNITYGQLTAAEVQLAAQAGVSATTTDPTIKAQLQTQALNSLISLTLLTQAAQQAGATASSTAVDAQIASAKQQLGSDAAYQQALQQQGVTEDQLRSQIAQNLAVQAYLESQLHLSTITATDAEITAAYNQVKASQGSATPPLSQVKDQVKQLVIQQKQQQLVNNLVAQLKAQSKIETMI